jgi:F420-dependent oxidoreductase-like protein
MRIGLTMRYDGGFRDAVAELADHEKAGAEVVYVPEAYSFDAVSQLGFIAAKTERIQIASGILPIYSRTPSLLAMTAAGLDYVSEGRFTLGIGASGPQVVEGFHGVRYDAPLARTREVIEICRAVWRREPVRHDGQYYQIPLPADKGSGLAKPLKLINHPVRERIPIMLAAVGPKNVALAAEVAEAWEPVFFLPERSGLVWDSALAEGAANRDPLLPKLDVVAEAKLLITEDRHAVAAALDNLRPKVALYVGGMGARDKNFYNDLFCRYGYEAQAKQVQDHYLDGHVNDAVAAVPDALLSAISLIGPHSFVRERIAAYATAGVRTLHLMPLAADRRERVRLIETVRAIANEC